MPRQVGAEFREIPDARGHVPATGKMQHLEAMRYRNGEGEKLPWIGGAWHDEGRPWALFDVEEIPLNLPVAVSVDTKGP